MNCEVNAPHIQRIVCIVLDMPLASSTECAKPPATILKDFRVLVCLHKCLLYLITNLHVTIISGWLTSC